MRTCLLIFLLCGLTLADEPPVAIDRLSRLYTLDDAPPLDRGLMAVTTALRTHYQVSVTATPLPDATGIDGFYVGRTAALASGLYTEAELLELRRDELRLRGRGGQVAIVGADSQATLRGVYRFLQLIGDDRLPHHGYGPRRFTVVAAAQIPAFDLMEQPYFHYRNLLLHVDRGRYVDDPSMQADPRAAALAEGLTLDPDAGWLDWFHSASYLVPKERYYSEHPEYYAWRGDSRIGPKTPHGATNLCLSNPAVHAIAAARARRWADLQPPARFLSVMDADARYCECDACRRLDRWPTYTTERLLDWVNHVATPLATTHPDLTVLTGAYMQTVKPPRHPMHLSPNVVVLYAPWFWDSRGAPSQPITHPANITAMRELMAWRLAYPGQVGVYEYSGIGDLYAKPQRLKLYAKHGIRHIYFNGLNSPTPELAHYICLRLLQDPYQDLSSILDEFMPGFYGPAAPAMREFLLAFHGVVSSRRRDLPGLLARLDRVGDAAQTMPPESRVAVLRHILLSLRQVIQLHLQVMTEASWEDCRARYVAAFKVMAATTHDLEMSWQQTHWTDARLTEQLERLDASWQATRHQSPWEQPPDPATMGPRTITFSDPSHWRAEVSADMDLTIAAAADGGVQLDLPISQFPTQALPLAHAPDNRVHTGAIYLEATMPEPLDMRGSRYLRLHLHSSTPLPVRILFDTGADSPGNASHVHLHAGEQWLRVDLRNYPSARRDRWDGRLYRLGLEIIPQDRVYPHPPARDARLTLLDLALTSDAAPVVPATDSPRIWLTQFRPTHQPSRVPQDAPTRPDGERLGSAQFYIYEQHRTFVSHRAVSPIDRILCEPGYEPIAQTAQAALIQRYAVALPIMVSTATTPDAIGNSLLVGSALAVASGRVTQAELAYVGTDGHVIAAQDGSIVLAAANPRAARIGLDRYLDMTRADAASTEWDGLLTEHYLLDLPSFPLDSWLELTPDPTAAPLTSAERTTAIATLRRAARDRQPLPESVRQALHRGLPARHLLWDASAESE